MNNEEHKTQQCFQIHSVFKPLVCHHNNATVNTKLQSHIMLTFTFNIRIMVISSMV